jgi:RNA polymerase sigma-70 factor (ECF subfamily)
VDALDLARWQFGITTIYHFLFVPLTIGLSVVVAALQTAWHRTGRPEYLRATKFFGKLFLINFAMGVVTGIVQETLIRAWRHPDVLTNGKGSARGWLLTVVRNLVTDRYRAKAARPQEVAENPDAPPMVRDHADSVVASVTVMAALDELSDDHRGVLDQIYFKGRSLGEAATALGIPAGTVKSRSYYALRALRQALAGTMSDSAAGREVPA